MGGVHYCGVFSGIARYGWMTKNRTCGILRARPRPRRAEVLRPERLARVRRRLDVSSRATGRRYGRRRRAGLFRGARDRWEDGTARVGRCDDVGSRLRWRRDGAKTREERGARDAGRVDGVDDGRGVCVHGRG